MMRTTLTRYLLAFLIAWLPVSLAGAVTMGCQAYVAKPAAGCAHASQHGKMTQGGAQHAPSMCHGCALCYSCSVAVPAIFSFNLPVTGLRSDFVPDQLASFFPEQPERPPRV
ncbi:MAG: hypothetical protein GC139_03505 [Sideroxydans sp.]|nr:hypothetical protein [Sideroxydans sp.]